jgi:hypothetical protein
VDTWSQIKTEAIFPGSSQKGVGMKLTVKNIASQELESGKRDQIFFDDDIPEPPASQT